MLLRPRLRPGDLVLRTGDEPSGKNTTAHGRADRASGTGDEAPQRDLPVEKSPRDPVRKGPRPDRPPESATLAEDFGALWRGWQCIRHERSHATWWCARSPQVWRRVAIGHALGKPRRWQRCGGPQGSMGDGKWESPCPPMRTRWPASESVSLSRGWPRGFWGAMAGSREAQQGLAALGLRGDVGVCDR